MADAGVQAQSQTTTGKSVYYPSQTRPECLSDGGAPAWLTVAQLFDNEKVCKVIYAFLLSDLHPS